MQNKDRFNRFFYMLNFNLADTMTDVELKKAGVRYEDFEMERKNSILELEKAIIKKFSKKLKVKQK